MEFLISGKPIEAELDTRTTLGAAPISVDLMRETLERPAALGPTWCRVVESAR